MKGRIIEKLNPFYNYRVNYLILTLILFSSSIYYYRTLIHDLLDYLNEQES